MSYEDMKDGYEDIPVDQAKDLMSMNDPGKHAKDNLINDNNKIKIGIVGHGFVGSAVDYAFTHPFVDKFIVDPKYDTTIDDLVEYEPFITFICAPTPMGDSGNIDASIVEDATLKLMEDTEGLVVIKSTITPEVIDRLSNSVYDDDVDRLIYNPEFLTEASSKEQFVMAPYHIVGGLPRATSEVVKIYKLFSLCTTDKYVEMSAPEAAFVKYGVNTFLATKVTFFNQLYDSVVDFGCNWPSIANAIGLDSRIGQGHTRVPGFDGKRGFGGACFPKDLKAFNKFDEKSLTLLAEIGRINDNYRKEYELDDREKSNNVNYDSDLSSDEFELGDTDVDNGQTKKELED